MGTPVMKYDRLLSVKKLNSEWERAQRLRSVERHALDKDVDYAAAMVASVVADAYSRAVGDDVQWVQVRELTNRLLLALLTRKITQRRRP